MGTAVFKCETCFKSTVVSPRLHLPSHESRRASQERAVSRYDHLTSLSYSPEGASEVEFILKDYRQNPFEENQPSDNRRSSRCSDKLLPIQLVNLGQVLKQSSERLI